MLGTKAACVWMLKTEFIDAIHARARKGAGMTLQDMEKPQELRRRIAQEKRRLKELELDAGGSSPLIAMAFGTRSNVSKVERAAERLIVQQERILALECEYYTALLRLERYIAEIPESRMRIIFTLRLAEGEPWQKIARRVGGDQTADSVKKAYMRFLAAGSEPKET